jgi:hypothetical protein
MIMSNKLECLPGKTIQPRVILQSSLLYPLLCLSYTENKSDANTAH